MNKVTPLQEGTFTVGFDKIFNQIDTSKEDLNERARGSLLVEVQSFLVQYNGLNILLDTGLGFKNPETNQYQLIELIEKEGLKAEDIDMVLMTHLHKDHAGGLHPEWFPNATFYIYKAELDFAKEKGFPSYYWEDLEPLTNHPQVTLLTETEGTINDFIHYQHTGGHCPEHIVYWLELDEDILFFGGDEAPKYKQMMVKYVAKYDHDGKKAMELREEWAVKGKQQGWTVLFYHDEKNPVVKLS